MAIKSIFLLDILAGIALKTDVLLTHDEKATVNTFLEANPGTDLQSLLLASMARAAQESSEESCGME